MQYTCAGAHVWSVLQPRHGAYSRRSAAGGKHGSSRNGSAAHLTDGAVGNWCRCTLELVAAILMEDVH